MRTALMILLLISSIVLIVSILLQSGNSDGLSGSIAGGAEQLFGKRKSRGYDALLSKITTVCAIFYIVDALAIVAIFNS
jgi:preprotein translocase subunit SecG